MEWLEADPLPQECLSCKEKDCYSCDIAGKRWYLPRKDDLLLRRKMLLKAVDRMERQIADIERELDTL